MNKTDRQMLKRMLVYVLPHRWKLCVGVGAALLFSAMESGRLLFVKPLIDDAIVGRDFRLLVLLASAALGVILVKGLVGYLNTYLISWVGMSIVMKLQNQVYRHLQRQSLDFFNVHSTGVLMAKVTNDVGAMGSLVAISIDLIREPLTALGLMMIALYMDWKLTLASFFILPVLAFIITRVGHTLRRYGRKSHEWIGQMTQLLQETISGIRIVKAFNMEAYEAGRYRAETKRLFNLGLKGIKVGALSSPLIEFLGMFSVLAICLYGGRRVISGEVSQGTFATFAIALFAMYKPIRRLNRLNTRIHTALAGAERVFALLDTEPTIRDKDNAIHFSESVQSICFESVTFRYEQENVLQDVSFEVGQNQVIALVGPSGAGKTTLVNLLPRFYDVSSGCITINGHDIRDLKVASLRYLFGIVTQDVILFNDSIANNIKYGDLDASREDMIAAAQAAYAHYFIEQLPKGYDTMVGERGVKLSGGQKQRIAIARALLKDPPLLILDEATSALDTESEREVQKALERLMQGRTSFVIAHRLSTILHADRIMVLEQGRMIESGTHQQLIEHSGVYKKLHALQFASTV